MYFSALVVWTGATSLAAAEITAQMKCRLPTHPAVHGAGG